MILKRTVGTLLALLAAVSVVKAFPTKPVRILVGYAAGGPTDVVARIIAERLTTMNGQSFIDENKPGASSSIATAEVVRAAPDGYTLLMAASNHTTNPAIMEKLPYDSTGDLRGLALVSEGPHVLVAHPGAPFASLKALIDYARSKPGQVAYSSSGQGGTVHFAGALLEDAAGIQLIHVPYRGAAPAVQDLLSGKVQVSPATLASVSSHIKAGQLRLLATASQKRLADFPDVPTFAELGFPQVTISAWAGFLLPSKTPREIADKLSAQISQILADPAVVAKIEALGMTPVGLMGRDFDARIAEEISMFSRLAKARNIKSE